MAINIRVRPVDTAEQIERKILEAVRRSLNTVLHQSVPSIRRRIQDMCEAVITNTEEYASLMSGQLLAELGIPDVQSRLRQILKAIRDSVGVQVNPIRIEGKHVQGGLSINMIRSGFEDILGLPAAQYISNGKYLIPWLHWLIVEGDRVVVLDYEVTYNLSSADRARSRTGLALMRPGSGWRVPPEYSGTIQDNFITRAFEGSQVERLVSDIMREEIQRRLN